MLYRNKLSRADIPGFGYKEKTYLFFLFILEFESRLNRTSFVKESSPHVDFVYQTQIEANEIQRGIKYAVGYKL